MADQRKRSYKMGHRGAAASQLKGQLSKNKWAWVRVYFGQFVIWADYATDDDGNQTDEVLNIKLLHPIPNRPSVAWNLTACTEEELISMKHLFDTAFAWALPYVQQRDKEAQDAFENGDDSHSRIYRQVPQLVYRSGPSGEHGEGVLDGSQDASPPSQPDGDPDGGLRDAGPDLAKPDPSDSSPEDDGATPD